MVKRQNNGGTVETLYKGNPWSEDKVALTAPSKDNNTQLSRDASASVMTLNGMLTVNK